MAVGVALVGAACGVPDRHGALSPPLSAEARAFLQPDTARVTRVADGVFHRYLWSPRGPWAVNLLEVRLDRCTLGLEVVRAPREPGKPGGRATVPELTRGHDRTVLAAVNGDFFTPEGVPIGPEVVRGDRRTGRARPALATRAGAGLPWIGVTGIGVDRVTRTGWPLGGEGPGAVQVVGGWPELLHRGELTDAVGDSVDAAFVTNPNPRTAVGIDTDGRRLVFVVVDGRQPGYSAGMSLPELARLLQAMGVDEALNLDGGGSSVLVVQDRPVNRPPGGGEGRPVANALLLVEDPAFCVSAAPSPG